MNREELAAAYAMPGLCSALQLRDELLAVAK